MPMMACADLRLVGVCGVCGVCVILFFLSVRKSILRSRAHLSSHWGSHSFTFSHPSQDGDGFARSHAIPGNQRMCVILLLSQCCIILCS